MNKWKDHRRYGSLRLEIINSVIEFNKFEIWVHKTLSNFLKNNWIVSCDPILKSYDLHSTNLKIAKLRAIEKFISVLHTTFHDIIKTIK